jgi:hypothetical protein
LGSPNPAERASRTDALSEILGSRYPFFRGVVERAVAGAGAAWAEELEETLARLFPSDHELGAAAHGYGRFAMDLMRRQRAFERDRAYPAKTYADALEEVYLDGEYMRTQYLPGLLLAHFLWVHHRHHMRFFESAFLAELARDPQPVFAEVGVGTGVYSRRTLQLVPAARGAGYDISPASRAFAEGHVQAFGFDHRYAVELRDVAAAPIEPVPWLVCIEVLEHLEDPVLFLRVLRGALTDGGKAFVSAALNAAHVDHIHLYERPEDVAADLRDAGFAVEQAFLATAYAPPGPGVPVPAVAAFIVS